MAQHLAAIAGKIEPGRHAVLLLDQASWHMSAHLVVPETAANASRFGDITIVPLPPKCPELNPQENILGQQSQLACLLFQGGEVGVWVATKPSAERPSVASLAETLAHLCPSCPIGPAQGGRGRRLQTRRRGCDQAHLAAQHGGGRGRLAPGRAPVVMTLRPEPLLEVVVGARQVGRAIAVEQPGPVAAGDLAEASNRVGERACFAAVPDHGADQAVEAVPNHRGAFVLVVVQHPRCRMHPSIGALHVGPKRGRVFQAAADQLAQLRELRRGTAPFCATRSRRNAKRLRLGCGRPCPAAP